jgi:diketogulonate reductase-like aldo/keto reductase
MMKKQKFGWTGVELPIAGQGTWNMERDGADAAVEALRAGLDLGMTHIDTAELYGHGDVEQLVARAIEGRRDDVFLASKVMPSNASYEGTKRACDRSLKRLRTDRLDLYLLHWPGAHPLEETLRAFADLAEAGKIRFFGVSNFDETELEDAVSIAGEGKIACNQVLYHLEERRIEHRVLPYCEKHDIAVVGYSPLGNGHFVSPASAGGRVLADIAARHGVGAEQVALRFLVREKHLFTIPKASQVAHVRANAAAGDLELTPDEIDHIDAAFPRGRNRSGLPTL